MNNMNVIMLEGVNNTGKSIFGKAFMLSNPNAMYFKNASVVSKSQVKKFKFAKAYSDALELLKFIKYFKPTILIDRWHSSEYVYSKIFNRKIDMKKLLRIDKLYADIGAKILYFDVDDKILKERWEKKDLINLNQVNSIRAAYSEFFEITKCDIETIYWNRIR